MSRILLVEDDADGAAVINMVLGSSPWEIETVTRVDEAMNRLLDAPQAFQMVIADMALPDLDGFELLKQIRTEPDLSHLPLLAITAFHTPELRVKALKAGFNAYLPKPLNPKDLMTTLQNLVG